MPVILLLFSAHTRYRTNTYFINYTHH